MVYTSTRVLLFFNPSALQYRSPVPSVAWFWKPRENFRVTLVTPPPMSH